MVMFPLPRLAAGRWIGPHKDRCTLKQVNERHLQYPNEQIPYLDLHRIAAHADLRGSMRNALSS
jgi:hypothetical protein